MTLDKILSDLDIDPGLVSGGNLSVITPIDGTEIGAVQSDDLETTEAKIARSTSAFRAWRSVPAPQRGEFIRLLGEELRAHRDALGRLVSLENGKILAEGIGEVQEMIDICDFAVGL
jgi:aldehyde dehydrogenase (NAD+)